MALSPRGADLVFADDRLHNVAPLGSGGIASERALMMSVELLGVKNWSAHKILLTDWDEVREEVRDTTPIHETIDDAYAAVMKATSGEMPTWKLKSAEFYGRSSSSLL